MADPLIRIKRMVLAQRVVFTMKAEAEMYADGLTHELVFEAIINAPTITRHSDRKTLSRGSVRPST